MRSAWSGSLDKERHLNYFPNAPAKAVDTSRSSSATRSVGIAVAPPQPLPQPTQLPLPPTTRRTSNVRRQRHHNHQQQQQQSPPFKQQQQQQQQLQRENDCSARNSVVSDSMTGASTTRSRSSRLANHCLSASLLPASACILNREHVHYHRPLQSAIVTAFASLVFIAAIIGGNHRYEPSPHIAARL